MSQEDKIRFSDLRKLMGKVFGLDDLHDLFMDLHMDPENADGKGKEAVIRYLVGECHKQKRFLELLQICAGERPAENWTQFEQLATVENDDLLAHPHLPVYKKWVVQQYNVMRLLGMERSLPLNAIYTNVYLLDKKQYWRDLDNDQTNKRLEAFSQRTSRLWSERHSSVEMLEQEKQLFIVGQPGAGKTTFLRWLAVSMARDELGLIKIPIFVELRRLNDKQYSIFDLIVKEWISSGFPKALAADYAEQLIRNGDALILLDGLDEVWQELRERVNNQIDDLVKMSGSSYLVITCRPHAETRRFETFAYMEVAGFSLGQTRQFIRNWFGNEEDKADKLFQDLVNREQKPVRELTKIPLLLALICIIFDRAGRLSLNRAELYSHALDVVLTRWDDERGVRRDSIYGQLSMARKEELLAYVAYHSFEAGQLFISQKELEKLIIDYWQEWRHVEIMKQKEEYGQVFPKELPEREVNANQVLTEIIVQHGIFVEQAKGIYSFLHLSFQEYFTAKYITNNTQQELLKRLITHVTDDQWREVFLLVTSCLHSNVDEFFTVFKDALNRLSQIDYVLTQLLRWLQTKAELAIDRKQLIYRPVAVRAWFLALNRDRDLTHARVGDRALAYSLALDFDVNLALDYVLDRALTLSRDLSRELDFATSLTLDLDSALTLSRTHFLNFDQNSYHLQEQAINNIHSDLSHDLSHAHELSLALNIARNLALDLGIENLSGSLVALSIPRVEESDEIWQQFAQSLAVIIEQHRDLSKLVYLKGGLSDKDKQAIEAMNCSNKGSEQYIDYLKATRLFADCLRLAKVTDRAAMEEQLLLPPKPNQNTKSENE